MLFDALSGFALGFSLILALGAQNVFVIRQGLRGEHVFTVAITCSLADALLIIAGVAGLGAIVSHNTWIAQYAAITGAAFLAFYGYISAEQAINDRKILKVPMGINGNKGQVILTCLALAFLNPHVYLDTVILLGSISTQYEHSYAFGAGAVGASFLFFFLIAYASRLLLPVFSNPIAWRVFDGLVALVMWAIAAMLLVKFVD